MVEVLERWRSALQARGGGLSLWSHEETGNGVTFARDRAVGRWARSHGVRWTEFPAGGVARGLRQRDGWARQWESWMHQPPLPVPLPLPAADLRHGEAVEVDGVVRGRACPGRQHATRAGTLVALETFLAYRGANYARAMSSPLTAPVSCSRLSLGLALGLVSLRETVQAVRAHLAGSDSRRDGALRQGAGRAFLARLHWRSHFMQKLESEPAIEFRAFVPELDALRDGPWTGAKADLLAAWEEGRTGYPLIDACMRCLRQTGWINFRMRAMLVSFASYDLWLPWRRSGLALARLFTDYEPGIHWPQVQMQSGTTGINTLRMYSPVKQSCDQDPDGRFIRTWVPELSQVPPAFVHEPWTMPPAVAERAGLKPGRDYPRPVVDHAEAVRAARARFAAVRRDPDMPAKAREVFLRHGSRRRPGTTVVEPRWFDGREGGAAPARQLDLNV
jgi:deoxyribodipyrimidine photo-lyase